MQIVNFEHTCVHMVIVFIFESKYQIENWCKINKFSDDQMDADIKTGFKTNCGDLMI